MRALTRVLMAAPNASMEGGTGDDGQMGREAMKKLEEALGKLDISEEEATPRVIDDRVDGGQVKWLLAGKVHHRNHFHI